MFERRNKQPRRNRSSERRRRRSRRHLGEERVLVIEINGSDLSAIELARGSSDTPDQISHYQLAWRKEAASLQGETGQHELVAGFSEIAKHFDWQSGTVNVILSGEFCVTRAVRGTNEEVRSELQRLNQRSRLYLSLGPGEKVMVSNVQALDARHQHALAAACNEKTLRSIQGAAESAGLQIASIEPALSAARRAVARIKNVPDTPYLLIHLDESAPDIGVCHEGQLLLDYRPGGRTDPQQLPELLTEHLSRLQRHTGRQLRDAPPELRQVYLCGNVKAVATALLAFREHDQFEVTQVDPRQVEATWEFREDAGTAATAPTIGSALTSYFTETERDGPNLMEHIIASTREPMKPVLIRSALPLAAVLLIGAVLAFVSYRKQNDVDLLQVDVSSLATAQSRATELRLSLLRADSKLKQLQAVASQLNMALGHDVVSRMGHCLPGDVWLDRIRLSDGKLLAVKGSSFLEDSIYDSVRWLEQAPWFDEVALKATRRTSSDAGPVISFELELNVEADDVETYNDQAEKVASHE